MGFRGGQEDPRNISISEVIDELHMRNRGSNDESAAMIGVVIEDYHRLVNHTKSLAAMQAREDLNDQQAYPHRHIGYDGRQHGPQREFRGPPPPPGSPPPQSRRPIWPPEVNGLPPRPPANDLPSIDLLNPLYPHSSGGRPGDSAGSRSLGTLQNPKIMSDGPGFSANSGRAPLSNIGSTPNVQANPRDVHGSASTSIRGAARTRVPLLTIHCGKFIQVPDRPRVIPYRKATTDRSKWKLRCILCNEVYRDYDSVYNHFPWCVGTFGNLNGARWYDHPSIDVSKIPERLLQ